MEEKFIIDNFFLEEKSRRIQKPIIHFLFLSFFHFFFHENLYFDMFKRKDCGCSYR